MEPVGCWAYTFPGGRLNRARVAINPVIPVAIRYCTQSLLILCCNFIHAHEALSHPLLRRKEVKISPMMPIRPRMTIAHIVRFRFVVDLTGFGYVGTTKGGGAVKVGKRVEVGNV
jgi:hypothetical protein